MRRVPALFCLLSLLATVTFAGEPDAAAAPLATATLPPPEPIPEDSALEEGYERIFNGKDLTGWEGNEKIWSVEKGMLLGRSQGIKHNEFVGAKENYKDFILKFKFQLVGIDGKGMINSGCQFRSQRVPNNTEACGYQADIGEGWWGALYDESRRNKVLVKPAKEDVEKALKRTQWNDYVVHAQGDKIILEINGVKMIEWTETEPAEKVARDGRIFFQVHSGGPLEIRLKDIRIKKL